MYRAESFVVWYGLIGGRLLDEAVSLWSRNIEGANNNRKFNKFENILCMFRSLLSILHNRRRKSATNGRHIINSVTIAMIASAERCI